MRQWRALVLLVGLGVLMTAALAGCSRPEDKLVGTWRTGDPQGRYVTSVFEKDGTYRYEAGNAQGVDESLAQSGRWALTTSQDHPAVAITLDSGGVVTKLYVIQESRLYLADDWQDLRDATADGRFFTKVQSTQNP